ncbi:MAG: hypothetical protein RL609_1654 [Bacteroidota bacterium]|jgi:hypothetical protein
MLPFFVRPFGQEAGGKNYFPFKIDLDQPHCGTETV